MIKLKLIEEKDRLNFDYWKILEKYKKIFNEKRGLNSKLLSLGRKKSDIENRILEIINELK